jgi:hypothetical protein
MDSLAEYYIHQGGGGGDSSSEHLENIFGHVLVDSPYVQRGNVIGSFLADLFRS